MKMYNNNKKMERKVVEEEEEEKISTLHGMRLLCPPLCWQPILWRIARPFSFQMVFSLSIVQFSLLHTDVSVFWKTKSCLIFDIHLSLDPLAAVGYICNTHTQKKVYNEWNEYKGGPSCRHADHFHRPQPFFMFYTQKRNEEGSPPIFLSFINFFLAKTFFSSRW